MDSFIMDDVYKLKYVRLVIKNIKLGLLSADEKNQIIHFMKKLFVSNFAKYNSMKTHI